MSGINEFKILKGHCPKCSDNRNSNVLGEHKTSYDADVCGVIYHRLLQCRGCESVFFQRLETSTEHFHYDGENQRFEVPDITHWPSPRKRRRPDWLETGHDVGDIQLTTLLRDVYVALDNDLGVLAAIGVRTVFDMASEHLGIDPSKTFKEKLSSLVSKGTIGAADFEHLSAMTDAGSAATHRGWRPAPSELHAMMDILESFLHKTCILDESAQGLKQRVPSKSPRPTKQTTH